MPVPAYPLPQVLPTLHLYRHLLREASYLPPAFRSTIVSTIRTRFYKSRKDGMHTKNRLAKAMSSLRTLRAANSGDKVAMQNLILKGFGRAGSRRRELMTQLVKSQGPNDTQALELLIDKAGEKAQRALSDAESSNVAKSTRKPKNAFFEKWDQPKLLKILESQKQQQKHTKGTTSWPGTAVRTVDPDQFVPKTNIWGKPPAESLVRTKRAHWWRRSADKVMPPLGKGEWDLLQRLSKGAQAEGEWAVPQRRHHVLSGLATQTETPRRWDWTPYATAPAATAERAKTMSRQRRTGQYDSGPYGGRERGKEVSGRWFRRAYNRVWQLTPTMEQDPNTLQYALSWGNAKSSLPAATAIQQQIFDDVDRRGKAIQEKTES